MPLHRRAEGLVRRDEHGASHLVVLGLREQIHGDVTRVGALVGDNADLARTRDHIDIYLAVDELFSRRDVYVAGSRDDVGFFDRLRAVGHRRYCRGAAHFVCLFDAANVHGS